MQLQPIRGAAHRGRSCCMMRCGSLSLKPAVTRKCSTFPSKAPLEARHPCLGHLLVLVDGTAAYAYGPGDLPIEQERDAAGEVDDPTLVGRLQAVERLPRLSHLG